MLLPVGYGFFRPLGGQRALAVALVVGFFGLASNGKLVEKVKLGETSLVSRAWAIFSDTVYFFGVEEGGRLIIAVGLAY